MIIQRYTCALFVCLAMHTQISGADVVQRSSSALTIPRKIATNPPLHAASDSEILKRGQKYQDMRLAVGMLLGACDFEYETEKLSDTEQEINFLPAGYDKNTNVFVDVEQAVAARASDNPVSSEISLPKIHATRPDKNETTYFVNAKRNEDSPTKKRVEASLAAFRERLESYRTKKVPSPSSRGPAEAFNQTGELEDFSPIAGASEDDWMFSMELGDDTQGGDDE